MRAVLQRVRRAAVRVSVEGTGAGDGAASGRAAGAEAGGAEPGPELETVGEITRPGLLALVGATHDDGPEQVATIVRKIAELRLFEGAASEAERGSEVSASDIGAPILVVSQFTLYADVRKGRRPSWNMAAPGEVAEPLVDAVVAGLRERGLEVATGRFGAHMLIDMEADGPVTILVEA